MPIITKKDGDDII